MPLQFAFLQGIGAFICQALTLQWSRGFPFLVFLRKVPPGIIPEPWSQEGFSGDPLLFMDIKEKLQNILDTTFTGDNSVSQEQKCRKIFWKQTKDFDQIYFLNLQFSDLQHPFIPSKKDIFEIFGSEMLALWDRHTRDLLVSIKLLQPRLFMEPLSSFFSAFNKVIPLQLKVSGFSIFFDFSEFSLKSDGSSVLNCSEINDNVIMYDPFQGQLLLNDLVVPYCYSTTSMLENLLYEFFLFLICRYEAIFSNLSRIC